VGPPVDPALLTRSVIGRPRALSDAQVAAVLAWHDSRQTLKQVAASHGVSPTTILNLIHSRGAHYKQAPPEKRAATLSGYRAWRRTLQTEQRW
jgi:hypothetical protein